MINSGEESRTRILRDMRQLVYGSGYFLHFFLAVLLQHLLSCCPLISTSSLDHRSKLWIISALRQTSGATIFSSFRQMWKSSTSVLSKTISHSSLDYEFFICPQGISLMGHTSCNNTDLHFYAKHTLTPSYTTELDNHQTSCCLQQKQISSLHRITNQTHLSHFSCTHTSFTWVLVAIL